MSNSTERGKKYYILIEQHYSDQYEHAVASVRALVAPLLMHGSCVAPRWVVDMSVRLCKYVFMCTRGMSDNKDMICGIPKHTRLITAQPSWHLMSEYIIKASSSKEISYCL